MDQQQDRPALRVDIVSDVVCPWCVVGYRQLAAAAAQTGTALDIHWHPFELNPDMAPEGENLRDHIMRKYGSAPEASAQARARLTELGEGLGFAFRFTDESRIVNTFQAHQLITWAEASGKAQNLKLALFEAYFTDGMDVSDAEVLAAAAAAAGLDPEAARAVLDSGELEEQTRQREAFWIRQGIQGVPAMVFAGRHLVTGAQGTGTYADILDQLGFGGAG